MKDPYAQYNPYQQIFNSFYSYRSPYTQSPAFAYTKNSQLKHYSYLENKHRSELIEAGAGLGLTGAGAALVSGKISAGIVGAKLAAAGLAIGSGGMIPLIGAVATLGAGAMVGAVGLRTAQVLGKKGVEGLEYLGEKAFANAGRLSSAAAKVLGTMAVKGTKASFKFAKQVTNSFLNKSKEALTKNMEQPAQLLQDYSKNTQAEKIFMDRLNTLNKAMQSGKDIKSDLKDVFKYKVPSQKALKALQNTTSYYFIKQNAEKNRGKINLKEINKDFKKFAKEVGLNKREAKLFQAHIPKMLENLKDNLIVTKDNQFAPFSFKIHQSIQEVAKQKSQNIQQNFEKKQKETIQIKDKDQGKQQMQQQLHQTNQKEHENISFGR
jgi:hypothetical protein